MTSKCSETNDISTFSIEYGKVTGILWQTNVEQSRINSNLNAIYSSIGIIA